eukprot:GHVO01042056.1.p1 GENE.GHVO01042056.1~~GHVO01042056.1.p1  ORF type:complete len:427 (+),score=125.97 GHVO01042056.1:140-1420(+)
MRRMMSPYSSVKLKTTRVNKLKDFTSAAGIFGVTHILSLSQTAASVNMRVARLPNGPTLGFEIVDFILSSDIKSVQKRPRSSNQDFQTPPLVVMTGFKNADAPPQSPPKKSRVDQAEEKPIGADGVRIMTAMISGLFPAIDVNHAKLSDCRRVVLFNRNSETGNVDVRHYAVQRKPSGTSRAVSKLVRTCSNPKNVPNLGKANSISDYILKGGGASDSEGEGADEISYPPVKKDDTPVIKEESDDNEVNPKKRKLENEGERKKEALALVELGPRVTLKLIKIEEEVFTGRVLCHRYVHKTSDELEALEEKAPELKSSRRHVDKKMQEMITEYETSQEFKKTIKTKKKAEKKKEKSGKKKKAAPAPEDEAPKTKRRPPPSKRFTENRLGQPIQKVPWGEKEERFMGRGKKDQNSKKGDKKHGDKEDE